MRQGTNPRRGRSRGNAKRHPSSRNQNVESNGPDVKLRGTPQQVHEKYLSLARDASSAGDRISAESYLQFADHYYRLANDQQSSGSANGRDRQQRGRGNGPADGEGGEQPDESQLRGDSDDAEADLPAESDDTTTENEPASA